MAKLEKKRRRIVVRNSSIHGRGVFALRRIPKGTRIIEYKGKLITDKEADRRYSRMHEHSPHTMLFSLEGGWVIDATRRGNSARWINHSCAPNCEIEEEGQPDFHRIAPRYPPRATNLLTTTTCRSARSTPRRRSASTPAFAARGAAAARCSAKKSEITGSIYSAIQIVLSEAVVEPLNICFEPVFQP